MLIKQVHIYDPIEEQYKRCDLRISNNTIHAIDSHLNEQEAEPWLDLSGYFAYPSFIESHCHLIGTGRKLIEPQLNKIGSIDELEETLKSVNAETVCLRGWVSDLNPFQLTRKCLDQMEPKRPVLLISNCGHIGYINSKAIQAFSLDKYHLFDGSDLELGVIKERVLDYARACITYSKQHFIDCLAQASALCKSYGISSAHSDDWTVSSAPYLLSVLDGQSDLRIYEHLNLSPPFSYKDFIQNDTLSLYFRNTPFLSISSFKFILDGSLGGRTAYLSSPYSDAIDNKGVLYYQNQELQDIIVRAEQCSWSTAFHIIGDGALEVFLNSFKQCETSNNRMKHRIIHAQMASSVQLDLLEKLGLYLSIQPIFYPSDKAMALKRLSLERFQEIAYPFKAMIDQNLHVSLSTDAPIEDINPFKNMLAAETFMSRKKAFYCYTVAGAQAIPNKPLQGTVKVGNFADMFFLREDLFSLPSNRLDSVVPDLIMFNGKWFNDLHPLALESKVGAL
jgi:predicted amidohydrolase YtcJ